MDNIPILIKEFVRVFQPYIKEKIIPWVGNDAVGLSILRNYPEKGKFIPAKNRKGESDSVALIKVGYLSFDKNGNANLFISVSKASRFLLKGNWDFIFNKDNDESPTKESLEESKNSKQPIDLEDNSRYIFNLKSKKIFDTERKKEVTPSEVIEQIYNLHLRTLSNSATLFRLKMYFQNKTMNIIGPFNENVKVLNLFLFGKTLRKSDDYSLGTFKPYSLKDLRTLSDEKIKVLGSDFPITYQTARTFAVTVLILFLVNYYFDYDVFGFVKLTNKSSENILFSATFIGVLLIIFDVILPIALLIIINILIKIRLWLMEKKIKFS